MNRLRPDLQIIIIRTESDLTPRNKKKIHMKNINSSILLCGRTGPYNNCQVLHAKPPTEITAWFILVRGIFGRRSSACTDRNIYGTNSSRKYFELFAFQPHGTFLCYYHFYGSRVGHRLGCSSYWPRSMKLPNNSINRTAQQLRCWVPSALRAPAAGYLKRQNSACRP